MWISKKDFERFYNLEKYVGETDLVDSYCHPLDPRPASLSALSEYELERIKACESKLQAICDHLGIKIEPVNQKWQIGSKDEDRKESD